MADLTSKFDKEDEGAVIEYLGVKFQKETKRVR
jgi:hypothetical protein